MTPHRDESLPILASGGALSEHHPDNDAGTAPSRARKRGLHDKKTAPCEARRVMRALVGACRYTWPRLTVGNAVLLYRYALLRLRCPALRTGYFHLGRGADIVVGPHARICFGREVRFMRDFTGHFMGQVTLGDGVFFNRGCHVVAQESLTIGAYCLFGEGVSIHDDNHVVGRGAEPIASCGLITRPVVIGSNVWVGAKAVILPGVHIGDNAVVGAGTVVTRDVPAHTVVAGVPARVIRAL